MPALLRQLASAFATGLGLGFRVDRLRGLGSPK